MGRFSLIDYLQFSACLFNHIISYTCEPENHGFQVVDGSPAVEMGTLCQETPFFAQALMAELTVIRFASSCRVRRSWKSLEPLPHTQLGYEPPLTAPNRSESNVCWPSSTINKSHARFSTTVTIVTNHCFSAIWVGVWLVSIEPQQPSTKDPGNPTGVDPADVPSFKRCTVTVTGLMSWFSCSQGYPQSSTALFPMVVSHSSSRYHHTSKK